MAKVTNGSKGASAREKRLAERRKRQQLQSGGQGTEGVAGTSRRRSRTRSPSGSSSTLTLSRSVSEELFADQSEAELSGRTAREADFSVSRERENIRRGGEEREGSRSPIRRTVRARTSTPEGEIDEEDLRWSLSRNIARRRRQEQRPERNNDGDVLRKEVRRLKMDLEEIKEVAGDTKMEWKNKSNEYQYGHNKSTLKTLRVVEEYFAGVSDEIGELEVRERVGKEIKKVEKRQKNLKIADRFGRTGWKVVEAYELDPIAEDNDDEKRLRKAASRVAEQERVEGGRFGSGWRSRNYSFRSRWDRSDNRSRSRRRSRSVSWTRTDRGQARAPGLCWDCNKEGHFRGSSKCEKRKK